MPDFPFCLRHIHNNQVFFSTISLPPTSVVGVLVSVAFEVVDDVDAIEAMFTLTTHNTNSVGTNNTNSIPWKLSIKWHGNYQ